MNIEELDLRSRKAKIAVCVVPVELEVHYIAKSVIRTDMDVSVEKEKLDNPYPETFEAGTELWASLNYVPDGNGNFVPDGMIRVCNDDILAWTVFTPEKFCEMFDWSSLYKKGRK